VSLSKIWLVTDREQTNVLLDQGLRIENDIVSPTNFTLPTLSSKLEALRDDVYNGKGFVIIRGLDTFAYSQRNLVTIYLGLTSYVAEVKGKQNQDGSMLGKY
jgi:hypothetical protein